MKPILANSRIERIRYELKFREAEVVRIKPLGASTLAITFRGAAFADFQSASFDDHIKFVFEVDGQTLRRDYTPRHFDQDKLELTIEFALHEHGHASRWARHAQVGQQAVIAGPRGSMIIPQDYTWHLLAGDLSALPAIRRRLEELPVSAQVMVIALAENPADHLALSGAMAARIHWVSSGTELQAALRDVDLPAGEGFVWCAGESATMLTARTILLERGIPKENMRVAAYWKRGEADFHERLD